MFARFSPHLTLSARLGGVFVLAGLLAACVESSAVKRSPVSVKEQMENVYRPPVDAQVARVAFLPISGDVQPPDALREMDDTFLAEFNKSQYFEGVAVDPSVMNDLIRQPAIASTDTLPPELLPALRQRYGADAVLFTDITQYRPYRPISIGVRSKLVSLRDGSILWSIDTVFDSSEPAIAATARDYGRVTVQNPVSSKPVDTAGTLMSPRRYARFVARELYTRLPGHLVSKPVR